MIETQTAETHPHFVHPERPVFTQEQLDAAPDPLDPASKLLVGEVIADVKRRLAEAIDPQIAPAVSLVALSLFAAEQLHASGKSEDTLIEGLDGRLAILRQERTVNRVRIEVVELAPEAGRRPKVAYYHGPHTDSCSCESEPDSPVHRDERHDWFRVEFWRPSTSPGQKLRDLFAGCVFVRSEGRSFAGAMRRARELGLVPPGLAFGGMAIPTDVPPPDGSTDRYLDYDEWKVLDLAWRRACAAAGENVAVPEDDQPTSPPAPEPDFSGEEATVTGADLDAKHEPTDGES